MFRRTKAKDGTDLNNILPKKIGHASEDSMDSFTGDQEIAGSTPPRSATFFRGD